MSGRRQPVAGQRAAFGRSGEERRPHAHELFECGDCAALAVAIEIDQNVAEIDEVERAQPVDERRVEEIACVPANLRAQRADNAIVLVFLREVSIAEQHRAGRTAKRIATVEAFARHGQRTFADIERLDAELVGAEPRVEHRHRHRVRLFAGRAGQTQQSQRLRFAHGAATRRTSFLRHLRECRERFAMPEEPCLGNDDRFDQRLKLLRRLLQLLPVARVQRGVVHLGREGRKTRTHRTFDGVHTERLGVEAHRVAQQAFDVLHVAHDAALTASAESASPSRAASNSNVRASSVSN